MKTLLSDLNLGGKVKNDLEWIFRMFTLGEVSKSQFSVFNDISHSCLKI